MKRIWLLVITTVILVMGAICWRWVPVRSLVRNPNVITRRDETLSGIVRLSDAIYILFYNGVHPSEVSSFEKLTELGIDHDIFLSDYDSEDGWHSAWAFQTSLNPELSLIIVSFGKNETFDNYANDDIWICCDTRDNELKITLHDLQAGETVIPLVSPVLPKNTFQLMKPRAEE